MRNALAFVRNPANLDVDGKFVDSIWKTRVRSGEQRLMLAMLEEALDSFFKHLQATDEKGKESFRKIEGWIEEKNSEWIFSFENVCAAAGISASYLRTELVRRKKEELRRRPMVHGGEGRMVAAGGG